MMAAIKTKNKKQEKSQIKQCLMHCLGINDEQYHLIRYELAFDYFKEKMYYPAVTRLFILSPTFFRWWDQQLTNYDKAFLAKNINTRNIINRYKDGVLSLNVFPSQQVAYIIRNEGTRALNKNPDNQKLKIY